MEDEDLDHIVRIHGMGINISEGASLSKWRLLGQETGDLLWVVHTRSGERGHFDLFIPQAEVDQGLADEASGRNPAVRLGLTAAGLSDPDTSEAGSLPGTPDYSEPPYPLDTAYLAGILGSSREGPEQDMWDVETFSISEDEVTCLSDETCSVTPSEDSSPATSSPPHPLPL